MATQVNGRSKAYDPGLTNTLLSTKLLSKDPFDSILPPSYIRGNLGEQYVVPLTSVIAMYFLSPDRRSATSPILHFTRIQERPPFNQLGFDNEDPDQVIANLNHDLSEDLARKKAAGNLALVRLVGELYGEKHYKINRVLTDIRATLYYRVLERARKASGLEPHELTNVHPEEVKRAIDYVSRRVASTRYLYDDQSDAYRNVRRNVQAYVSMVDRLPWGDTDKREAKAIAGRILSALDRLESNLIPSSDIKKEIAPLIKGLHTSIDEIVPNATEYMRNPRAVLGENCVFPFKDGESPLLHMLGHKQYGLFVGDILAFSRDLEHIMLGIANFPPKLKLQDGADNLRIEAVHTPSQQHKAYEKARTRSYNGREWAQDLEHRAESGAKEAPLVVELHDREWLRRVITDFTNLTAPSDSDHEAQWKWIISQYDRILGYVGPRVEAGLVQELTTAMNSPDRRTRESAKLLLHEHKQLADILAGGTGETSIWRRWLPGNVSL